MTPKYTVALKFLYSALAGGALFSQMPSHAGSLPGESVYIGQIRRDASGKLVAVPDQSVNPAAEEAAAPLPTAPLVTSHPTTTPAATGAGLSKTKGSASSKTPAIVAPTPTSTSVASPRTLHVGANQAIRSISVAAAQARDGDTIEVDAGNYLGDVTIWKQNNLTIRGVGGRPRLVATGVSAEGKAIWVMRGGNITVENIEFTGARVPDKNGAGIRFEKGHLTVRNCRFLDNENGILTNNDGGIDLDIENSEFGHNGAGDGRSHNIYVGAIHRLRVSGSYFHHANVGHLLKSRAAENHILYNRLTDEIGGHASYELEFPNGGIAYVIGNIIEQSSTTENSNIVSFGAEGYKWPKNEFYLINNTIVNNRPQGGNFLALKQGVGVVRAMNNLLIGKQPLNTGLDGVFLNNLNVDWEPFVLAVRHDYRIKNKNGFQRGYISPGSANGMDLAPTREYIHPATTRSLSAPPTLPGARQSMQADNAVGG